MPNYELAATHRVRCLYSEQDDEAKFLLLYLVYFDGIVANLLSVEIKHLDLKSKLERIVFFATAFALVLSAFFVARWGLGSYIYEQTQDKTLLNIAERYSPHDWNIPQVKGLLWSRNVRPGDELNAVAAYERAVSLSPKDYRLWLELGKAFERADDMDKAEKALRQSSALAPAYALPSWLLGNFLLRQRRFDEAFAELRKAGETLDLFRPQVIALAWQAYDKDFAAVSRALGDGPAMRAAFVGFLTNSNKPDEAFTLWSGMSDAERQEQKEIGKELMNAFAKDKRWRDVSQINKQLNNETVALGTVLNASFEEDIRLSGSSHFGWHIGDGPQPQIAIDASEKRTGERSLVLSFTSASGIEFRNVSQIVLTEPASRYSLEYFYRVAELTTIGSVKLEVIDASGDGGVLASSEPVPTGSHGWRPIKLDFSTQPKTEAVLIRLVRVPCAGGNCPIVGKIWYDDFSIQKSN